MRRDDPFAIHTVASAGVAGSASRLPHLDAIQASFGHHDVSGVRAHVGGAAADAATRIGATGYATGNDVAFAGSPDLHLAAHEAAHVVQQRGGVRLSGGVGAAGDLYEQHADAVADAVVRGQPAEALLDTLAHRGAAGGPAVQQRRRTVYYTDPVPGPDGTATESVDHAGLATASFEELCAAYAMAAPADPEAPVAIGGAHVSYTWIRSRVGTVVLRGEIRAALRRDGTTGVDAHAATVTALTGDAARQAELQSLVEETRSGDPALLDEHDGIATFATRRGTSGATAEDIAAVAGRPHHASDIRARAGTGVYAPLAGQVIFSGGAVGYGNLIRLLHTSPPPTRSAGSAPVQTVYAHLCERLVAVGDSVSAGQAIGMVGRTTGDEDPDGDGEGYSGTVRPTTAPRAAHLHMAVILQSDAPDPDRYATPIENRSEIHPDRWLRELGVTISADPVLRMTESEAAAAQAAAVAGGGMTETRHVTREVPDATDVVRPKAIDGVGQAGDPYEHHADAVADAVVRGESVEGLLDGMSGRSASGATGSRAVQRDGEEVYGSDTVLSLPEGVTADDVEAALDYNNGRGLRIDWVRRLQTHVRADGAMTSIDGRFDRDTIAGLMRVQQAAGITVDGRVTPAMRRLLERLYPDLASTLLGSHLGSRVLVSGSATTAERYACYRDIITRAGGVFLDQPREINLLAIRGVVITGTPPSLEISQSGSAGEMATARAEDATALADGSAAGDHLHSDDAHPPEHFSGRAGFDDVIISIWFELGDDGTTPTYHVTERRGSVDPASAWSDSGANSRADTEGTAHLRDGQYVYHLGDHTTEAPGHAHAVWDEYHGVEDSPVEVAGTRDEPTYSALLPSRGLEIWRDRPGTTGSASHDDHYPTAAEEIESDERVTDHNWRYTSAAIAINIHSSPHGGPSSVGCQTVPVDAGYDDLIGEVRGSANSDAVYYTLIDASRIDDDLVIVRSAPQSPQAAPPADSPVP
jgi:Peptidase family M23/Domain of unknown function (DUF4157)